MWPELKKGDRVITPLGEGVVEHFEIIPALEAENPSIYFADELPQGSRSTWTPRRTWHRVGVSGTRSGVKPVAYFSALEVAPYDEVIKCTMCGKELWFRDSFSPGDEAICAECDTEVTGRPHAPTQDPAATLPPWTT